MLGFETLLGAAGLGTGSGVLKLVFNIWRESVSHKREMELKRADNDKEIAIEAIHANRETKKELFKQKYEEVEIDNEGKRSMLFFGKEFGWSWKTKKDKLVTGPFMSAYSFSFRMLVLTLCALTFIWGDDTTQRAVTTVNPDRVPTEISLLGFQVFSVQLGQAETIVLTTGGLSFLLLHLICGLVTHIMVSESGNLMAGRKK
jgi:hypothetical protein